jgi:beta-lactamase superfamily II metal-dependent hydrolase
MKRLLAALLPTLALTTLLAAQPKSTKPLEIYVVDTEGGKAALYVSPAGQSLLIDSGNPGGRDTDRIMAAVADAGVKQIDHLISTHYHGDHVGGVQELAARIPIRDYIDHGPSVEPREPLPGFNQAYAALYGKARHTVVKPGDRVPITGLDWRIVTSGGQAIKTPLPGGGRPNPACTQFSPKQAAADDDNAQSVGSVITFGRFRAIDLGDLLWNKESELMCPNNPIGPVDVYFVTHHGLDVSGSATVVHGVRPRVAVMQNGTGKGAAFEAMATMRSSPGLEDIWQLHWAYGAGLEQNSAGLFIANVEPPATVAAVLTATAPGSGPAGAAAAGAHTPAYWIKVSAQEDGTFTVTNSRNGFSKTYTKLPPAR